MCVCVCDLPLRSLPDMCYVCRYSSLIDTSMIEQKTAGVVVKL